jgi:prepilin signal peptidase PulO-like enzyme (type II secretory pathway)
VAVVILWSTLVGLARAASLRPGRRGRPPDEGRAGPALPFGPFLVLAAFLYLFRGPAFIAWYWSLTA